MHPSDTSLAAHQTSGNSVRRGWVLAVWWLSVASVAGANSGSGLIDAVIGGNAVNVKTLLEHGASTKTLSADGQTPLYLAAEQGRVEIATALLDHGADVNATSPTSIESPYLRVPVPGSGLPAFLPNDRKSLQQMASDTPLVIAAWRGHSDMVGLLIARGAELGARSAFGWNALLAAAKNGHRDVAMVLLRAKADIESVNGVGETPLHVAISFNHPDLVKDLMDRGANVNSRNHAGETPLIAALTGVLYGRQKQLDVVNRLLEAGADANVAPPNRMPPLALAANSGNRDLVEAILNHGATDEAKTIALDNAIQFGKIAVIETLLKHAATSGSPRPVLGHRLLYAAVLSNQIEAAKVLLKHGVDVNANDEAQGTALSYAALTGDLAFVNLLLEHGADVNIVRRGQPTPLFNAADQGRMDMVTALLDRGADVNGGQGTTRTPLLVAIQKGHLRIVETLLDHGAPLNGSDGADWTPLLIAVGSGRSDIATLLLNRGADANHHRNPRDTPLHLSARSGNFEITKALLDHGAVPNVRTDSGQTPLHHVAGTNYHAVAKLLLERGAAVNEENADGKTALHLVSHRGSGEVAAALLDGRANVKALDRFGNTPLFDASSFGRADIVGLLLARGVDVNAVAGNGRSPLHVAADSGHIEIVTVLLKHGARINAKDEADQTPLHAAYQAGRTDVVTLLKDKGAKTQVEDRMGMRPRDYAPEPEGPEYSREEMVALEHTFDEIWKRMATALRKGDGPGALRYIVEERRPTYEDVFSDLVRGSKSSGLDTLFGDSFLHCFVPGNDWDTVRKDWVRSIYRSYWHRHNVICEMVRTEQGTKYSYEIQFTRDRDNVWRISGF